RRTRIAHVSPLPPARASSLPSDALPLHARAHGRDGGRAGAHAHPVTRRTRMTTGREQYIIGVDLGGTNIVAGALTLDGTKHLAMRSIPTNSSAGDEAVAERIVALVEGVFLDAISETGATRQDFVG